MVFLLHPLDQLEWEQTMIVKGRGGGQVVSVLAFYSYDSSLNPTETYSFFL